MSNANVRNADVLSGKMITTAGRDFYTYRKGDVGGFTRYGVLESVEPNREDETRELTGNVKGKTKVYKRVKDRSTFSMTIQTSATADRFVREMFVGSTAITADELGGDPWAANHAYVLDDLVEEGGRLYRVTVAGNSGAGPEPVWPTDRGTTVQGGAATFIDIGTPEENAIRAYSNDAGISDVAAIYVQSTEESDGQSGRSIVRVFPNGTIEGTGEPTIQDFDGFEFTFTGGANTGFVPPIEFGDFGTAKPDGFVYDVPNHRVDELVDALKTALIAYRDGL